MRAVFLGTPEAAVPSLHALAAVGDVRLVITRPDRPRGRSAAPQPPPVKVAAAAAGMDVAQPATAGEMAALLSRDPPDVAVVVAFGMLIREEALAVPPAGFVNVHFSVLPRWRGAAPVPRAIMAGDHRTGVTLMRLDTGLDTGPILATHTTAIGRAEDAGELTSRLAMLGGRLLGSHLPAIVDGRVVATAQDESRATSAPRLRSEERWIDLQRPVADVLRQVRGLAPWPGAWVRNGDLGLRIVAAEAADGVSDIGHVAVGDGSVLVGAGDGVIRLVRVQPEGRRVMDASDWARGLRGQVVLG